MTKTTLLAITITSIAVLGLFGTLQQTSALSSHFLGDSSGNLWSVTVPDGDETFIGDMDHVMTDIAVDPTSDILYAITTTNLYSIDTSNADSNLIGAHGINGANALVISPAGIAYVASFTSDVLYTLDLTGAGSAPVGNMGGGFRSSGDLAWDTTTSMLWFTSSRPSADTLVNVDPADAMAASVGPIGFRQVFGLGFDSGTLYGHTSAGKLLEINTMTGAGTEIASHGVLTFGSTEIIFVIPEEIVDADIKPGSDPSSVNCKKTKGTVPVALFGSDTFDVLTIDHSSFELNGVPLTEKHGTIHIEDKNGDAFPDVVLHFDKAGICEATSDAPLKESVDVTLTGSNDDGDFTATGDIRIVKR